MALTRAAMIRQPSAKWIQVCVHLPILSSPLSRLAKVAATGAAAPKVTIRSTRASRSSHRRARAAEDFRCSFGFRGRGLEACNQTHDSARSLRISCRLLLPNLAHFFALAEGVRFELTVDLRPRRFSRPLP